jgi:DNA-binding transcriptional LysR family regulator
VWLNTRAGEEVNLSQPSVSVRIRQLENELGVKLFEQLGKRVVLTEAGQLLITNARRVITAIEDAKQSIEELQGFERGALRIGASTTPGMYLIPRTVAHFKERYPKIEIHLGIRDTRQIEAAVISNEFDFGFVGGHLAGDEVEVVPWLTDQLVLVVAPKHPLARKKSVKAEELQKERFIMRETRSATRAAIVAHLEQSNLKVEIIKEMENPESVKKAVQSGLGIAFISKFAVETELKAESLVAVRVRGLDICRELKIVYRKDKHLGRAAQRFIEMARQ